MKKLGKKRNWVVASLDMFVNAIIVIVDVSLEVIESIIESIID